MNAASLFSSVGIGEYYLKKININVIVANELVKNRAEAHKIIYPSCQMINGDITKQDIQQQIIKKCIEKDVKIIIATPPCQGVSSVGKNRKENSIFEDPRNFLILSALKVVDKVSPDYFIIENVPRFKKMLFPYENDFISLYELMKLKYSQEYDLSCDIFNAAEYGVAQNRQRIVYRMWKKGLKWANPEKKKMVTLEEAIGDLPSIEAGETSHIKNHNARSHPKNQIESMKHTPTGQSALKNDYYYPRKKDGTRIKGYGNTYKRMRWDAPAPTITMRNEIISSQENVHPGRKIGENLWSDSRVLTLRELLIVSSLPADMDRPINLSETTFRQLIGEGIPPLLMKEIMKGIRI